MELLQCLFSEQQWQRFLAYKVSGGHLSRKEEQALSEWISAKNYLPVAEHLNSGGFFSLPEAVKINKRFSEKKRTVFLFPEAENLVQKMLAFELLCFDGIFADNLYSFRRNKGVKKAVTRLVHLPDIRCMYSYKLDISDYFGSVNAAKLFPMLEKIFSEDKAFLRVLEQLLFSKEAIVEGEVRTLKKGILAGCPLSGFLANVYLNELDRHFCEQGVVYARYSDDIIVFAASAQELETHRQTILSYLHAHDLSVNESKEQWSAPGEAWTFLGFCYRDGVVDIAEVSKQKLKKKMKRKARALARWAKRKNAPPERAVHAFIRYFNNKLYHNAIHHELTWARWYFPIINTAQSLKELDAFEQQCIRYLATGTYTKRQYDFTYERMKRCGYVPLVGEYYRFKAGKKE